MKLVTCRPRFLGLLFCSANTVLCGTNSLLCCETFRSLFGGEHAACFRLLLDQELTGFGLLGLELRSKGSEPPLLLGSIFVEIVESAHSVARDNGFPRLDPRLCGEQPLSCFPLRQLLDGLRPSRVCGRSLGLLSRPGCTPRGRLSG